ncbi:unnamed protein product [Calicophoron daubneyi]|uniref:Uncharacterized protein n=1 Tax=Calicophoron daubneyi TaxID=300641 RepID=A0AAV2TZC0_CALDB
MPDDISWVSCNRDSEVPPNAVHVDKEMFVIRGNYSGDTIPGKWVRNLHSGYVSHGGREIQLDNFEVLCIPKDRYQWEKSRDGQPPSGAIEAGNTSGGEKLYVAQGKINGQKCIGKLHPSHKCAYFPWGTAEHRETKCKDANEREVVLSPRHPNHIMNLDLNDDPPPSYWEIYPNGCPDFPPHCRCERSFSCSGDELCTSGPAPRSQPPSRRPGPRPFYPSASVCPGSYPGVWSSMGAGAQSAFNTLTPQASNKAEACREEFYWVECKATNPPPPDAVKAEGEVYVIRQKYKGDLIPGKWPVRLKKGYISYGGREIELSSFEVLCIPRANYQWIEASRGKIPPGAVIGGKTANGETLYIARGRVNNEPCTGKVQPSHRCAYYPWRFREHKRENYTVLCFF